MLILETVRLEHQLDRPQPASQRLQALLDGDPPAKTRTHAEELLRSIAGEFGEDARP